MLKVKADAALLDKGKALCQSLELALTAAVQNDTEVTEDQARNWIMIVDRLIENLMELKQEIIKRAMTSPLG